MLAAAVFLPVGCLDNAPVTQVAGVEDAALVAPPAEPYHGQNDPYEPGSLSVRSLDIPSGQHAAPVPLRIHVPETPGPCAVVVFQHGFLGFNFSYDTILRHLASHGFVVVAPQMYEPGFLTLFNKPNATEEARTAARVLDWLPEHLSEAAQARVRVDRLGLAGHSRGGKVSWLMLSTGAPAVQAFVGVDPVDGPEVLFGNQAPVIDGPLDRPLPALFIGAGLAGTCAFTGYNHEHFYSAWRSPAWDVVALDYGHADMLDPPAAAAAASMVCASNPDGTGMRELAAGLMVAFFRGTLQGDPAALSYLTDAAAAPVRVQIKAK